MYAGDFGSSNLRDLRIAAWMAAVEIADRFRWHIPKGRETLKTLAKRACDELIYPNLTHCPNCGGSGRVHPNDHNRDGECKACNTSGKRIPDEYEMAELIGVTPEEWRNVWAMRYLRIYARILEWHAIGCANVRKKLGDE
jgi:ribosomal protein L32